MKKASLLAFYSISNFIVPSVGQVFRTREKVFNKHTSKNASRNNILKMAKSWAYSKVQDINEIEELYKYCHIINNLLKFIVPTTGHPINSQ